MFTIPQNGWADIVWDGNNLGRISGIDDVPCMILDALIQYFTAGNKLPFGVVFDAEGWDVGFTEVAEELYFFDTKTNGTIPNFVNLSAAAHCSGNECIRKMAGELILDFETSLDDWAAFSVFYYEEKEQKKAVRKNKRILQGKIKKLKRLLNEYRRKNS